MNTGPEAGMRTACGKASEGMATAGAEQGPWKGMGAKVEEGPWGHSRDGPRALPGFFSTGCNF